MSTKYDTLKCVSSSNLIFRFRYSFLLWTKTLTLIERKWTVFLFGFLFVSNQEATLGGYLNVIFSTQSIYRLSPKFWYMNWTQFPNWINRKHSMQIPFSLDTNEHYLIGWLNDQVEPVNRHSRKLRVSGSFCAWFAPTNNTQTHRRHIRRERWSVLVHWITAITSETLCTNKNTTDNIPIHVINYY